jgi:hypothetical protein
VVLRLPAQARWRSKTWYLVKWFILLSSHPPGNYLLYFPHASNLITKDDQIFPGQFCWSGNCVALVCVYLVSLRTFATGETMQENQLNELLYQALETEKGGVEIYRTALQCAINEDLKEEWEEFC